MRNSVYLLLGVIIILFVHACGDKHGKNYNKNSQVDENGALFVKNGIEGGLTEIKASGLAITNSNNQKVIGLAKMMIDDHTKAGDELLKIEKDNQISEKDTISADHQKLISDLSGKSGAAFDKAYLQMMVADHTQAIDLYTTAGTNPNAEIKTFATGTLTTIKMHLDSANAVLAGLK